MKSSKKRKGSGRTKSRASDPLTEEMMSFAVGTIQEWFRGYTDLIRLEGNEKTFQYKIVTTEYTPRGMRFIVLEGPFFGDPVGAFEVKVSVRRLSS